MEIPLPERAPVVKAVEKGNDDANSAGDGDSEDHGHCYPQQWTMLGPRSMGDDWNPLWPRPSRRCSERGRKERVRGNAAAVEPEAQKETEWAAIAGVIAATAVAS